MTSTTLIQKTTVLRYRWETKSKINLYQEVRLVVVQVEHLNAQEIQVLQVPVSASIWHDQIGLSMRPCKVLILKSQFQLFFQFWFRNYKII